MNPEPLLFSKQMDFIDCDTKNLYVRAAHCGNSYFVTFLRDKFKVDHAGTCLIEIRAAAFLRFCIQFICHNSPKSMKDF